MADAHALIHLAKAEHALASCKTQVVRQREDLANLLRNGHDTTEARQLLEEFETTLALYLAHRDRLLRKFTS